MICKTKHCNEEVYKQDDIQYAKLGLCKSCLIEWWWKGEDNAPEPTEYELLNKPLNKPL